MTPLVLLLGLAAQHGHSPAPAQTAVLRPGMGTHHFPIRTGSPQAQKFFDQGLAMLYGFNHEEARASFARAAELDPKAAMPLWGVALAVGANYNDPGDEPREKLAYDSIHKALLLVSDAAPRERDYVQALATRYSADRRVPGSPEARARAVAYAQAMAALAEKYPDDLDARTLAAEARMNLNPWKLWTPDGKPAEGTPEIVAMLESVLRRDPDHPGANHYYIHAVEASPTPERALPSANRLAALVPAAGHLVHMPGHIYLRVGDYEAAAKTNIAAVAADQRYLGPKPSPGIYSLMYFNHNRHFVAYARSEQGLFPEAIAAARAIANSVRPHLHAMPMLGAYAAMPYFVLARFERWKDILAEPAPKGRDVQGILWLWARALALAQTGKLDEARATRATFLQAVRDTPKDTPWGSVNLLSDAAEVASAEMEARIAEASGDRTLAIAAWRRAAQQNDRLNYDEPPAWYFPVREALAATLFRDGQFAAAETEYRANLEIYPRNPRSLLGLAECLSAQGKRDAADSVRRLASAVWKGAAKSTSPAH